MIANQAERLPEQTDPHLPRRGSLVCAVLVITSIAAVMRIPSCGESFWLDELHSAWVASGPLDQVGRRASLGNQIPAYFYGLWVWARMFGDSEAAMRASSVALACLTAGGLTLAVTLRTRRLASGWVAGGLFAADPNAIFFGCELRPYSAVMFCAFAACAFAMLGVVGARRGSMDLRPADRAVWYGLPTMLWISAAAIIHPTSLIVLMWLVLAVCVWRYLICGLRFSPVDVGVFVVVSVTMAVLWSSSLPESWQRRQLWKAFGRASDISQLWQAWDFWPLVLVPVLIVTAAVLIDRVASQLTGTAVKPLLRNRLSVASLPLAVALLGTGSCFVLSYFDWVPLWHRRYYVAALPLMAWTAGECVAIAQRATSLWGRPRVIAWLLVLGLLGFQLWSTGYLATMTAGQWPRELRGERWREVVARVAVERGDDDLIWLDSGLIEARFLADPEERSADIEAAEWEYLAFPLSSVYKLQPVTVMACWEHPVRTAKRIRRLSEGPATVWLISRGGSKSRDAFLRRVQKSRRVSATPIAEGSPSVTRLEFGSRRS